MIRIKNSSNTRKPLYIGKKCPYRINVLIGMSTKCDYSGLLNSALKYENEGADSIQDVSICGDITGFKKNLSQIVSIPCGTVAAYELYDTFCNEETVNRNSAKSILLDQIERDCENGFDFITFHSSLNKELLSNSTSKIGSRGGSLVRDIILNFKIENPLYDNLEDILEILSYYNVTLALGSTFRAYTQFDFNNNSFRSELKIQKYIYELAKNYGVSVFLEGISHISRDNMLVYCNEVKRSFPGAEITCLGPLSTDAAMGYDHVCGAIGTIEASRHGFVLSSAITAKEHYELPKEYDVLEALKAYRISKHLISLEKGLFPYRDKIVSKARENLNWDLISKASILKIDTKNTNQNGCSICGSKCPILKNIIKSSCKKELKLHLDKIDCVCRPYTIDINNIFYEAISRIIEHEVVGVMVFGSIVTGDFVIVNKNTKIYASDIELIVLSKKDKIDIVKSIQELNKKYSKGHYGFNVNVSVFEEEVLFDRMEKSSVFNNTIIKQALLVYGNNKVIDRVKNTNFKQHTLKDAFEYLKNILDELLINLDERISGTLNLDRHISINILKFIVKYSSFINYYNNREFNSYAESVKFIKNNTNHTLYKLIYDSYKSLHNNRLHYLHSAISVFNTVKDHFIENYEEKNIIKQLEFLTIFLSECAHNKESNDIINKERTIKVLNILKGKHEHYQFYKDCYGL